MTPSNERSRATDARTGLDRRSILKGIAGGAAVAGAASFPRTTFAQDAPATPGATPGATPVGTPGATPIAAASGYYPSGSDAVPDAYTQAPEPFVSYDGVPGRGGTVRAFAIGYNPPPPSRDQNPYWQELERRLGVTWEPEMVPQPNFGERSAAYFASGDLPDIFYMNPQQGAPQQWQALAQGAFLDLTDYLTGDALAQFRNLATFPQYAWDNVRFQGRIYGIPRVSGARFSSLPFYRADWVDNLGLAHPTSPDSVREMLVAFSKGDPDGNGNADTYGMGRHWFGWHVMDNKLAAYMHRVPRDWHINADGSMVFANETPEYRQEVEWQARVWAEGGFHPDAPSMTHPQAQAAFIAGQTGLHLDALATILSPANVLSKMQLNNPNARLAPYMPVGPDGLPGATWNDPGFFGFTGIPASTTDEERILELLRILDYLAAPFGSEESNFLGVGIEGIHHSVNEAGARIFNDQGRLEKSDLVAPMNGIPVYYYPEQPEIALQMQQIALQSAAIGRDNPSQTLFSPTNVEMGPQLEQLGVDRIAAIVSGRESMDSFDSAVAEWRDRGGDQIRGELQEALQQQGG